MPHERSTHAMGPSSRHYRHTRWLLGSGLHHTRNAGFLWQVTYYVSRLSKCLNCISAYSFLDPKKQGALLAGYIVGIAVAQCVIFAVVRTLIVARERIVRRSGTSAEIEARGHNHDK